MDKRQTQFVAILLFFCLFSCNSIKHTNEKETGDNKTSTDQQVSVNRLSNWTMQFDGESTKGWRGFKKDSVPAGWIVDDGKLVSLGQGGDFGGDIITKDQFEDFELYLEWAISKGGNSGIFFHVLEGDYPTVYATGPEYQILDDTGYPHPVEEWQKAGANYAMHNATDKTLKPVGEFNSSRIKVLDGKVEHWLNGVNILTYELWTDDWYARVHNSKWKDHPGYGLARKGHIGLQDHGSIVQFQHIKIVDLTDKGNPLFNGKNLEGWKIHGTEKWYAEAGTLVCESGPDKAYGYLATNDEYRDFILRLEFKQESNGNSGVFFRSSLEGTKISGWQVEVAPKGNDSGGIYESYGRGWLHQIPDEKEGVLKEGEWNEMIIRLRGDRVMTWLNNELMTDLQDDKIGKTNGKIALQIHDGGDVKVRWRNIYIHEMGF